MNTLTQQQINQYQWQVADGVARMYSKHTKREDWNLIYQQYQTNAPDGIYGGEAFEVIKAVLDVAYNKPRPVKSEQEAINLENLNRSVFDFLRLKPSHLPAVLTTQPVDEWKDRYKAWLISLTQKDAEMPVGYDYVIPYLNCGVWRVEYRLITPSAEQEAVEKEPLVSFKFKHPDGTVLTSAFYSVDDLLKTSIEDIQDKTRTCECQPIGETNVVECNCIDYYEQFEYAGKVWSTKHLQSILSQKDQRIAELERERDMHKTIVQSCLSVFEYVLENNDGVGVCLGYQADSIMESMVKKIKALPIPPQH